MRRAPQAEGLLIAGGAWLITGDPVRALAVLVVATPCPLMVASSTKRDTAGSQARW